MKVFLTVLAFVVFQSCSNYIGFAENQTLSRPVGMSLTALSGQKFQITYTVQNQEAVFDGYNVYAELTDFSEGEINSTVFPLLVDGSEPTLKHSPEDFNLSKKITVEFQYLSDTVTKFEVGSTYTFKMAAHGRNGERSLLSPALTAKALP
ncbi:MAG: hypothetical protein D6767_04840 [Candidatus Hydrogenedentota bacterium]|nr:MAG: hypothetical protein D6767_04840 [Candidatus Hydrogenedentota bacterium]